MKIYTKTGDNGTTQLIGGRRVAKSHIRIESYGTVDELNSWLGLIATQPVLSAFRETINYIQDRLFTIGALLATDPEKSKMILPDLTHDDIIMLEQHIDTIDNELPALKNFIIPGGSDVVSYCHIARCVCRRAERVTVQLAETSLVDEKITIYLNRLSDFLFMLARKTSFEQQIPEQNWKPRV